MNYTFENGVLRIPTQDGVIKVTPDSDSDCPGVWVGLEREDGVEDSIALIECNKEDALQTFIWEKVSDCDDYTHKIKHEIPKIESEEK